MDPLSITLAVLSLSGTAIKIFSAIREQIKICREFCREIGRIECSWELHLYRFENEVRLLLRDVGRESNIVDQMLQSCSHPDWSSSSLESDLQRTLGDGCGIWLRTANVIKDQLEHFEKKLTPLFKHIQNSKKRNPFTHGLHRIAAPLMFSFDKTELDSIIGILRDSLQDLEWLRKRPYEMGSPAATFSGLVGSGISSRHQYKIESIRRAARETFEALQSLFEIENPDSKGVLRCRHSASIIDGEIDQDVYMNVVIACHGHETMQSSMNTSWKELRIIPSTSKSRDLHSRAVAAVAVPEEPLLVSTICGSKGSHSALLREVDHTYYLVNVKDACQGNFSHSIHFEGVTTIEAKSVDEALDWPIETSLNITDQLKIARDLVAAVLKFYATPWLKEYFSLKDVRFFTISEDESKSLQTLHLGIDFDGTGRNTKLHISNNAPCDWVQEQEFYDARLQHGIRNSTLWSLGVVLLQIGSWSRTPAPNDVEAVRKASMRSSRMGPQYQKLTKQCLDCDFGHGEDLSETPLQLAVYENIFGKLTTMVDSVSLQDV